MPDLNPQQFYHGTRAPLSPGAILRPHNELSNTRGKPNFADFKDHSRGKVFMTDDEDLAWGYASMGDLRPKGRTSVLRVTPSPDYREGPAETTAKSAKVDDRIDIMPGRQGTLPVNWNQFGKKPDGSYGDPLNHPSNLAVEHGHLEERRLVMEANSPPDRFAEQKAQRKAQREHEASHEGQGRLF